MNTHWSAVTAAQAAVDLDKTMFEMLHDGVGWRALAPAVRDLARITALRFAREGNDRGLRLLQTVDPKRIRDLATLASQDYGIDLNELASVTVKLATKIMRGTVRRPFVHPRISKLTDEHVITAGLCIVSVMIIGIDANCRRMAGDEEASIWTVIDSLRGKTLVPAN